MTVNKNEAGISLPQAFTFNASNQQVRTICIDGEPYFVAKRHLRHSRLNKHSNGGAIA